MCFRLGLRVRVGDSCSMCQPWIERSPIRLTHHRPPVTLPHHPRPCSRASHLSIVSETYVKSKGRLTPLPTIPRGKDTVSRTLAQNSRRSSLTGLPLLLPTPEKPATPVEVLERSSGMAIRSLPLDRSSALRISASRSYARRLSWWFGQKNGDSCRSWPGDQIRRLSCRSIGHRKDRFLYSFVSL